MIRKKCKPHWRHRQPYIHMILFDVLLRTYMRCIYIKKKGIGIINAMELIMDLNYAHLIKY